MLTERVQIQKSDGDGEEDSRVHRLSDIEPQFVALVTAGANRQVKFQVVKADDSNKPRCKDCDVEFVEGACPECGEKLDAKSQATCSSGCEVEALKSGANLSFPIGDPTDKSLYGDPVNLKYPLAYDDGELDVARIKSALVLFKRSHGSYKQDSSKSVVYGRIVAVALSVGIDVTYDKDSEIDKLLPAEIVQSLSGVEGGGRVGKDDDGKKKKQKANGDTDVLAWLDLASASADDLLIESMASASEIDPNASLPPSVGKADTGAPRTQRPSVKWNRERKELTEKLDAANARIGKLEAQNLKIKKELRITKTKIAKFGRGLGGATAIVVGSVAKASNVSKGDNGGGDSSLWNSGGDMSAGIK